MCRCGDDDSDIWFGGIRHLSMASGICAAAIRRDRMYGLFIAQLSVAYVLPRCELFYMYVDILKNTKNS